MKRLYLLLTLLFLTSIIHAELVLKHCSNSARFSSIQPSVSIGILVRNKAHSLPYFLYHLEQLNYPKDRIYIYFGIDNSIDQSAEIVDIWVQSVSSKYHGIDVEVDAEVDPEKKPNWTAEHYAHLIKMRQRALKMAHDIGADFFFSLDADVILLNRDTLTHLVETLRLNRAVVIAPMLNCTSSEVFSNFWGAMTEEGYYKRSSDYFAIQRGHIKGVFRVAMIHTAILMNIQDPAGAKLAYDPPPSNYNGPTDDMILFARRAQIEGVEFLLDNRQFFGYFPMPLDESELTEDVRNSAKHWVEREAEFFVHLRLNSMIDERTDSLLKHSPKLESFVQPTVPEKAGFDQIYLINLERRPDRLRKMNYSLAELGIDAKLILATDGKQLSLDKLKELNITQLTGYADPYHKRALKLGEIGCFLSHYRIWQDMLLNNYERILILEDDLRFIPGFMRLLKATVAEADASVSDWELLYIGRKRMSKGEIRVPKTRYLAYPSYTYWTLGYALTKSGTQKLMIQKPLERLIAVDEFLPIMFDKHPNKAWLSQFNPRNLIALSAEPLLVEPTQYTGELNYISDTEDSSVIPTELLRS